MNVMCGIAPLDNLDTKAKYQCLGRPQKMVVPYDLWKEGELVMPMKVPMNLLTETFYLGDFDSAFKAGTEIKRLSISPAPYCAPERLHGVDPSFGGDMWAYMYLFAELYLGIGPWKYKHCPWAINQMVHVLGPMPEQWKDHYMRKGNDKWYGQSEMADPSSGLEQCIKRCRPDTSPTEQSHALSIMSKVFFYFPEDRLTATQLLQDPSFKALMEIYGC
jgi:serine/threonine protein kinase